MNIKGLEKLMQMRLPVTRNIYLFGTLSEIPEGHIDAYGDENKWAMRGFDYTNTNMTDSPYETREARSEHGFSRSSLERVFSQLEKELDEKFAGQERLYFVCEAFTDKDVDFSGSAFRNTQNIYIDICNGNRPSRRDWDPEISFQIPVLGEIPAFSKVPSSGYKPHVIRICKDMMTLSENTYVDFTCLKRYFFYHDMGQISPNKKW